MKKFCVATDSGCDLPLSKCEEKEIYTLKLEYRFGDELIIDSMMHSDCHKFYERMRAGEVPKTSQVNIMQFVEFWKSLADKNLPIVHICLGSGVSGTYSNGLLAIDMFHEEYPDIPVFLIDSTLCSVGYGVLAMIAADMRDEGKTAEECADYLNKRKAQMQPYYTTDDLTYLYRSGRVSKAGMVVAHALNINPILNLDLEGHLLVIEKVRGQKNTIKRIHKIIEELVVEPENQTLYICHSDIPEKAEEFGNEIKEKFGFKDVYYTYIGPTIGSHCGPGLMAAFFFGKDRTMPAK